MQKNYNPAIRNGKPVLVGKAKMEEPSGEDYVDAFPYTFDDKGYDRDLDTYEQHLANLEVLEVSKELLDAFPECWYQEWGFYDGNPIEVFYPEGHTGKQQLVEGVDFNITRPFHMEGTQRVQRLVAIPLPRVIQEKEINMPPIPGAVMSAYHLGKKPLLYTDEYLRFALEGLLKALTIIQKKREEQAGLSELEHCIQPAYNLLYNLLNKK